MTAAPAPPPTVTPVLPPPPASIPPTAVPRPAPQSRPTVPSNWGQSQRQTNNSELFQQRTTASTSTSAVAPQAFPVPPARPTTQSNNPYRNPYVPANSSNAAPNRPAVQTTMAVYTTSAAPHQTGGTADVPVDLITPTNGSETATQPIATRPTDNAPTSQVANQSRTPRTTDSTHLASSNGSEAAMQPIATRPTDNAPTNQVANQSRTPRTTDTTHLASSQDTLTTSDGKSIQGLSQRPNSGAKQIESMSFADLKNLLTRVVRDQDLYRNYEGTVFVVHARMKGGHKYFNIEKIKKKKRKKDERKEVSRCLY